MERPSLSTLHDEGVPRHPDLLQEYFREGGRGSGVALYVALTALGTKLGSPEVSQQYMALPVTIRRAAGTYAATVSPEYDIDVRTNDRGRRLAERQQYSDTIGA